ncbi:MAG TPA: phospholipase [Anaerolineae bacterium]|nr:phospholipase [Anaerolineae bacterium]
MSRLHQGQLILTAGAPLNEAHAAVIMLHGRGANAESILSLVPEIDPGGVAYLAPQAANNTWYPYRFLASIESNEPWLSSAFQAIDDVVAQVTTLIRPENVLFLGFSQGACLMSEYIARHARRYGGVAVLSGGLIGPEGTPRNYIGSLDRTPIFIGCSDVDPHIPLARVHDTTNVLRQLGGEVTERIYPAMDHTINPDEIDVVRAMLMKVTSNA